MTHPRPATSELSSEASSSSRSCPDGYFATTHWTRVLEAGGRSPEAKAALSDLCATYYAPVFAFIRRHAASEDAARDLTQEFFTRLLARETLGAVDPRRGRFRSYLLGAVKHFLSDAHDHAHRLKRRPAQPMQPIDGGTDTPSGVQISNPDRLSPEREFDRKWAMTVLERSMARLAVEQEAAGKSEQFQVLKPWLTGDCEETSQAEAARRLNINENAVKVAIHRLRRRFRDEVKAELAQTLRHPSDVAGELACLLAALS